MAKSVIVTFILLAVSMAYILPIEPDEEFYEQNCNRIWRMQSFCQIYIWKLPHCHPWDTSLCTYYLAAGPKCKFFDCKVILKIFVLYVS